MMWVLCTRPLLRWNISDQVKHDTQAMNPVHEKYQMYVYYKLYSDFYIPVS